LTGDALDLDLARRRFAGRRDLDERDLLTLNLLARDGRSCVPTTGAILLFGRERLRHFPDARIRLARFAGTSRANLADRLEVESDPIQAIEDAIAFLGRSIPVGMALAGARRRDLPQFAPTALREAVVNAVVHADYSQSGSPIRIAVFDDRVEIENPGLLPFGLTIEEIQRGVSKLRNRIIGRVFHELGLIEQWGSGIRRMTEACEALGAPPPTFEEIATCFRVTLHAAAGKQRLALSGTAERIHQLMADGKSRSTAAIAGKLGMSPRTVRTHILRLVEQGLIVEIGKGPTDPRRVYRRAGLR
ncbi:MAG: winged helix-turn-helix transcriptional regulator, partial [Planctomycetes bacterium]|nr:winged helix-turn-helix transcriptional regulator [Planctomycetota bacterium]